MRISIRNAPHAKLGLYSLVDYIKQFRKTEEMILAEIGCYVGDSTQIFGKFFKSVIAIDPWKNGYDDSDAASFMHPMHIIERQFDENLKAYPNINKLKLSSEEAVKICPPIDIVYIDGIHTYEGCKDDIKRWIPLIRSGGFLAGHDFQGRFPGVMKAVKEFGTPDKIFADTSWVFKL